MRNPRFQICCSDGKSVCKPLDPLPEVLANLLRGDDEKSREFERNVKSYNSALSFTSINASLDQSLANLRVGAYTFRIHGSVHHLISNSLTPGNNNDGQQQRPQFAQIYFFDSENELQNRMNVAANSEVDSSTMLALQEMMHEINSFVEYFKTMADMDAENRQSSSDAIGRDIRMIFRAENTPDLRRYNAPTAAEIGVVVLDGFYNLTII